MALVHAVTGDRAGLVGRALELRPLQALGVISYGVYLWHWPVIVYVTSERVGLTSWMLDGLRVGLTLVAAAMSYRLVERPLRRGALRGPVVRVGLPAVRCDTRSGTTAGWPCSGTAGDGGGRRTRCTGYIPAGHALDVVDSGPLLGPAWQHGRSEGGCGERLAAVLHDPRTRGGQPRATAIATVRVPTCPHAWAEWRQ